MPKDDLEYFSIGELCYKHKSTKLLAKDISALDSKDGEILVFGAGDSQWRVKKIKEVINTPAVIIGAFGRISVRLCFEKFIVRDGVLAFSPKDERLDIRYLFYVLQSRLLELQKLAEIKTIPALLPSQIEALKILLPPLLVQRIVCDNLDKLRDELAGSIENSGELVQKSFDYHRQRLLEFRSNV